MGTNGLMDYYFLTARIDAGQRLWTQTSSWLGVMPSLSEGDLVQPADVGVVLAPDNPHNMFQIKEIHQLPGSTANVYLIPSLAVQDSVP